VAIADVCDKGLGAALFMTLIRTLVRAFATSRTETDTTRCANEATPVELTNEYVLLNHVDTHMFATLFFGVIDLATGQLAYVNSGHEPALIVDAGGVRARLGPTGPSIGLFPDARFLVQRTVLQPGDTLLLFTDGVTEARDTQGSFFGRERLTRLLEKPVESAAQLVARIHQSLSEFSMGAVQSDDVTMLAVRRSQ
jgi:sigma-B regulation protein RsbU (phosphoserine phosphatase)